MFRNLNLSVKLWLFTGFFLAIIAVVSFNSFWTLDRVIEDSHHQAEMSEHHAFLQEKEIDHLNWTRKLQDVFAQNQPEVTVQLDHTQCKLGRFIHGPESEVLAAVSPQMVEALGHLKSEHQHLHNTAKEIDAVWGARHIGLEKRLYQVLDSHRKWAAGVASMIINKDATLNIQLNPKACAFGKFLGSIELKQWGRDFPLLRETVASLEEPHRRLHHSATRIKSAIVRNEMEEAIGIFKEIVEPTLAEIERKFNAVVRAESAIVDGQSRAISLFNEKTVPALQATRERLGGMIAQINTLQQEVQQQSAENQRFSNILTGAVLVAALLIGGLIAALLIRALMAPVRQLTDMMEHVDACGDFSQRAEIDQEDEIGHMAQAFDHMLESLQSVIEQTNRVVSSVAAGNFNERVDKELNGDLDTLKQGVNASAESVQRTMHALEQVMISLGEGDFSARMSDEVEESYRNMVNGAVMGLDEIIQRMDAVMVRVSMGDFSQRIEVDVKGDLDHLKQALNTSLDALEDAVKQISSAAGRMSEGNLTREIDGDYQGQLAIMKDALNATQSSLSHVVAQVRMSAQNVGSGANEIAKGNQDLSSRTSEQAASLEETAASMEQMASTVNLNADNSSMTKDLVKQVRDEAEAGSEVVQTAVSAMDKINESSQKISDIITLIDGIAFQTNLLALNAAVEAARAGEHGRGFAVVANEVRGLAQRAADAAKEITGLIEDSTHRVEEGHRLVVQSGDALTQIRNAVFKVDTMIGEIAAAAQEQRSGIDQVNIAIAEIDTVNQQNAALVEEAAAASGSLDRQAESLTQLVSFFKLDPKQEERARNASNFSDTFIKARSAHLAWKGKIRGFLSGVVEMDEKQAVSHHDCVLGKWLDSEGRAQYGHLQEMKELDVVHEQMHNLIRKIVQLKNGGQVDQAEREFSSIDTLSKQVVGLLDKIEQKVSSGNEVVMTEAAAVSTPSKAPAPVQRVVQSTPVSSSDEWDDF